MSIRFDLSDFSRNRGQFKKDIDQLVMDVTERLTIDIHRNVSEASPVDTGTFRGAWTAETPQKPYDRGTVENATRYAQPLTDGHSKQAPAGWFDNAITGAVRGGGK